MVLFTGKKFKILTGNLISNAEIIDIQDIFIIVLINGKKFKMYKQTLINKFVEYEQEKISKEEKQRNEFLDYESEKRAKLAKRRNKIDNYELEKNTKLEKQCKNCMEYKKGECIGALEICDDFRYSPKLSDEELARWPKNGQVSRVKSDTFIIKETDSMYNKYNETYH